MAQQLEPATAIDQTFINEYVPRLDVQPIHETELTAEILDEFLVNVGQYRSIGLSPTYSSGDLSLLAIANKSNVLLVKFYTEKTGRGPPSITVRPCSAKARQLLEENVLFLPHARIVAFDFAPLALLLHKEHRIRLMNGVDIQSCCPVKDRQPFTSIKFAAGESELFPDNINAAFSDMEHSTGQMDVALRAWVSQYIPQLAGMEDRFEKAPKINLTAFTDPQLEFLAKLAHDSLRLYLGKPLETTHDVSATWDQTQMRFESQRYQTRLRPSPHQRVEMKVNGRSGSYLLKGKTDKVSGKDAVINVDASLAGKEVRTVRTVGREGRTNAEAQRELAILRILQGIGSITENPWYQNIWFSSDSQTWPPSWKVNKKEPVSLDVDPERPLNDSQIDAIQYMLSEEDNDRIVLVQGPPGTGKTSVISRFVETAVSAGYRGIWLVAQSNVAVKNIAEKLLANGFTDWRLLVSQDFHLGWHEHLYRGISSLMIRSDELTSRGFNARATLQRSQVILCTLSMLSSQPLQRSGILRVVPIKTMVVDEASQIEIGDYIAVFTEHKSIRKVCFIGDDKQLPPHGQEDHQDLRSIFEMENLRKSAVFLFLDTQYRMPPQLGDFVSKLVYDDKLQSNPRHPVKKSINACHFIDVVGGKETFSGKSWMNPLEIQAVITIARQLENDGKRYRIITPYDAQRSRLEESMKTENLQWEDKCFNVDSFQGNEEDYIIISLVRSRELGFLKNLRRTNVMLTRCKYGMFICSSQAFLNGPQGSKTLVGQLLKHVGEGAWLDLKDLDKVKYIS